MSLRVQVAPIIGLPQYRGWSQVAINSSKNFVCVFAIEGENASNFGRDLAEKILNFDLQSSTELHQKLLDILADVRKSDNKIYFASGLFLENKSTFATYNGNILLKRENQIGQILSSTTDLKLIEGNHKLTDLYVFSTHEASQYLNEIKQKLSQSFEIDTIITSIVPGIHSQENSSLNSLCFVELQNYYFAPNTNDDPEVNNTDKYTTDPNLNQTDQSPDLRVDNNIIGTVTNKKNQTRLTVKKISQKLLVKLKSIKKMLFNFFLLMRFVILKIISIIKIIFSNDIYLGAEKRKRYLRILILATLAITITISVFLIRSSQIQAEKNNALNELSPILSRLSEANNLVDTNPIESRKIAQESLEELRLIAKNFENKKYAEQIISTEINKAEKFNESISGLKEFQELPMFFDLRLVEANFVAQKSDATDNLAYFLDTEKKQLISLDLERKQSKTINLESIDKPVNITSSANSVYILGNGIHNYEITADTVNKIKDEGDSNKDGIFINNFGSYLYVFNSEKRNIYRYLIDSDQKLSDPIGWIANKQNLDFAEIKSIAVDGDIWLGTKNGEVKKYTRGEPVDFTMKNIPELTTSPLVVYTKEGFNNIYLLESEKNRLIILQKDGQFLREIKSESLASATSLFVNENNNIAYAVSGSIIFEIRL